MAPGVDVREVGEGDFDAEVLERSFDVPVLVDFWAPWCGPCRMLGPVLEQATAELDGKVVLVKANTEDHPGLATRFGIRGIPAVKLFHDGKVVGEFVGAMPGGAVRKFLADHIPSEADALSVEAARLLGDGDIDQAKATLLRVLELDERHAPAHLVLARIALAEGDREAVEAHIDAIDPLSDEADAAGFVKDALTLTEECARAGGEDACRERLAENADDLDARYGLGCCLAAAGHYREALDELLGVVERNRRHRDEAARRSMLTIFGLLGHRSDLTDEYQRKLQILL